MNNHIESAFADTKNLEMTPEVEQEVNKIYKEKEGIYMKNNNDMIKRGTEIKTMKESFIYALTFLKESCQLYKKYVLDWVNWIENVESLEYFKDTFLSPDCYDKEYVEYVESIKIEDGMCNKILHKTISDIEELKKILENPEEIIIREKVNILDSDLKDLQLLKDLYNNNLYYNSSYSDFHNSFFVCIPLYSSFIMIENSIEAISHIVNSCRKFDKEFLLRQIEEL